MNARIVRSTLTAVVLMLSLVLRDPILTFIVVLPWGIAESYILAKRFGRKGIVGYSLLVATTVGFIGYQGYVVWSNLVLISKIKGFGAFASMSGNVLPGPINYIALGPDVGDAELANIVALDGLDNLNELVANGSRITDDGLLTLRKFKRLKSIYVGGSKVTRQGVANLKGHLPDCLIVFDSDK